MEEGEREREITILYGSQTGTASDLAVRLFQTSRRHHFDPSLHSLADFGLLGLLEVDLACFVVSTTGQGEVPTAMLDFWNLLLRADLGDKFLEDLDFCILGLGDTKYPKYNFTAKKLRRRLLQLGAKEILDIGLCNESDNEGLDTMSVPWIAKFEEFLRQETGLAPLGLDFLLPPIYPLQIRENTLINGHHSNIPNRGGVMATVTQTTRVTPITHFQDVRHIKFDLQSKLDPVVPGDIISFTPSNTESDVDRFLQLLKWTSHADTELCLSKASSLPTPLPNPLTLRTLAKYVFPLRGIPNQFLFTSLRSFCTNPDFKEKFDEWETAEGRDDFYDYITRAKRTLLESLEDFSDGIDVDWRYALELFGALQAREYSISNSAVRADGTTEIEILVAMVKYQTRIKAPRIGVCSAFLAALECPVSLEVKVKKNAMPKPAQHQEVLCIGPGTGYAPLRFLLMFYRPKPSTLVFGCRTNDDHFPSHPYLAITADESSLVDIHTAFSRTGKREYVQHILAGPPLSTIVKRVVANGGLVYLSGSSGAMPARVRECIDALCGHGTVSALEQTGRWWEETW